MHRHAEHEPIQSLTWACCTLTTGQSIIQSFASPDAHPYTDAEVHIRLIATAASGQTSIYTLEHKAPSTWTVAQPPATVEGSARPVSGGSIVLDAKSGARRPANRAGLASVLQKDELLGADPALKSIWVSVGAKSVRTLLNVNGERIAKAEWGSKAGTVEHVEVVRRLGEPFSDAGSR